MACIKKKHEKPSGQKGEENKQNNALLSFATEQQAPLFKTHVQAYPLSIPMVKAEISLLLKSFNNSQ
jgi:hypothetical protein